MPLINFSSLEEALTKANEQESEEIVIAGGSSIYMQSLPTADRLYLTLIHKDIAGDAFFPDYSAFREVLEKEDLDGEEFSYTFLTLQK